MNCRSKPRTSNSSEGSVITECLLVIPVMLIIFSGLVELGRTFSQINWVANTSYEVAMVGGGTPQSSWDLAMQSRYSQLKDIPYYKVNMPSATVNQFNPLDTPAGSLPARSVGVQIRATLPTLLSYVSPTFDVHAVAPMLVLGNGLPGQLSVFQNATEGGSPRYYNCAGQPLPIGSGYCSSCLPEACP